MTDKTKKILKVVGTVGLVASMGLLVAVGVSEKDALQIALGAFGFISLLLGFIGK